MAIFCAQAIRIKPPAFFIIFIKGIKNEKEVKSDFNRDMRVDLLKLPCRVQLFAVYR
mgnify:CR=1 FL=1